MEIQNIAANLSNIKLDQFQIEQILDMGYYSQPISKTKYIYEDMSQYNEVCPFIIPLSLMVTSYKLYASNRKIQR